MPAPRIVRPDLGEDRLRDLRLYVTEMWRRAEQGRTQVVEVDYPKWSNAYEAIPLEKVRNVPWPNSSNVVVPLIRIFTDTFVARTLAVTFATKPLYVVDGFKREVKEALELYLNRKAIYEWDHYRLAHRMLFRGNKYGTCISKIPWVEDYTIDVQPSEDGSFQEQELLRFDGPKASVVPFEDFFVYPITANDLSEAEIKFHRIRYTEETARRKAAQGTWDLTEADLATALREPRDAKRERQATEAGVDDQHYRELQVIECHLDWELEEGRTYSLVALYQPELFRLIDVYFNPYPRNVNIFQEYKPFPRDDFFWGESIAQVLGPFQEECSAMHNERRNNSFISSAPVFRLASGAMVPNPATSWYPGKVFTVENKDDLDVLTVGRNYDDMIQQESFTIQLAERLSGIGSVQQGYAAGMMGKRGIYNASGTMAILSESNERQNTNIRDFRVVLSDVAKTSFMLQRTYGANDPSIALFPDDVQQQIRDGLAAATPEQIARSHFEVRTSDAAANKETERTALFQMVQVLGQYGAQVQQIGMQLANPKLNPSIRLIMNDILHMHKWMASRVLRAFNEYDVDGVLPDVRQAIERTVPGGGETTQSEAEALGGPERALAGLEFGGAGGAGGPVTRQSLQSLLEVPGAPV